MDLSFARFDRVEQDVVTTALPLDLALLLVGIAARQATSPTAALQQRQSSGTIGSTPFASPSGAFNAGTAASIAGWKQE